MLAICALGLWSTFASAQLKVEPQIVEFGVVKAGDEHSTKVTVTNIGAESVHIERAAVSCSRCTSVDFSPITLKPLQKDEVVIYFAPPESEAGFVQRDVAFITSDAPPAPTRVWLQAYVTDTVGWWPAQLVLQKPQLPGTHIQKIIKLVNVSDEPIHFGLKSRPANSPDIGLPQMIKAKETMQVPLTWDLPAKSGEYSGQLTVQLPHGTDAKLTFSYYAKVQGP